MGVSDNQYMKEMNDYILTHIRRSFSDQTGPDCVGDDAVGYFFITIMFKKGAVSIQQASGTVFSRFGVLYNTVCEALIGKNHHRPNVAKLRPVVAAFLDAEGSRYANRLVTPVNAHIHSIWAVHPTHVGKLEDTFRSPKMVNDRERYGVDKIDIQRLKSLDDLRSVTSYSTKLMAYNYKSQDVGQDFEFYPKANK